MRVYIGPYPFRWISKVHTNYMNKKYGYYEWDDNHNKFEHFLEKFEGFLQTVYNLTINKIIRQEPKVKVQVERYDIWSLDYTISLVIVPLLELLQKQKHGSPMVDDEDVPDHLKSTSAAPKENEWETDNLHHDRWEWVLNEMIWAFKQKARNGWEGDYYKYEHVEPDKNSEYVGDKLGLKLVWSDDEGRKKHHERMVNGFRLFGKYFEALWD
jgi:hypothetical protein